MREVSITTDRGSVKRSLAPTSAPQKVAVPAGLSSKLTIRLDKVMPPSQASPYGNIGAGISDIVIPGVSIHLRMQTPSDEFCVFLWTRETGP